MIITCRTLYWDLYFKPLSHLHFTTYTLPPYNNDELDMALANYNLKRTDIREDILTLIRKPRYFDLMVKYREKITETGDVTVARLIYEDWHDRLERKQSISLSDDEFKQFICELAGKYKEGDKYIKNQAIEQALPPFLEDKKIIFEELRTGGILQNNRSGMRYKVDEQRLIYGFGLLLVNELEETYEDQIKDIPEAIAEWLEPHAEMDIKGAICGFAALHALHLREYPKQVKIALLQTWINSRNLQQSLEDDFLAYLPIDPQCYIDFAEIV